MAPDVDGRTGMAKVTGEFLHLSVATAHKNVSCIRTCCEHGNAARPFTWEKGHSKRFPLVRSPELRKATINILSVCQSA